MGRSTHIHPRQVFVMDLQVFRGLMTDVIPDRVLSLLWALLGRMTIYNSILDGDQFIYMK